MKMPPFPADEEKRLEELASLKIVDTPDEASFNDIVKLASHLSGCPVSLISLVTANRQWFKAKIGVTASETARDISSCGHTILEDQLLEIPNALDNIRFSDNPMVSNLLKELNFVDSQKLEFVMPLEAAKPETESILKDAKILVVEDSSDNQELFELFLTKAAALIEMMKKKYLNQVTH